MLDMKPCPFCGSKKVSIYWHRFRVGAPTFSVSCDDCWASTESKVTPEDAVKEWNELTIEKQEANDAQQKNTE